MRRHQTTTPAPHRRRMSASTAAALPAAALFACLGAPAPLLAQNATAVASGGIEEIIVTARKRAERLQDVPASISAFTGANLRQLGIRDITEVALQTPGFAMQNNSRQNEQPFIRGMSVNSVFRDQQNASFFIDGIYVAGVARTINFADIERVEVVIGPQGALFGRATFAGAVNYISKRPTFDPGGEVTLGVGEHGLYESTFGFSSGLIKDKLAGRIFLQGLRYGGEFRNSVDGRKVGRQKTQGGSGSFLFTPSENFDATVRFQYTKFNDSHSPVNVVGAARNNCRPNATGVFQFFCGAIPASETIALNLDQLVGLGFRKVSQYRGSALLNWRLGEYTLTSVTGYNYEVQRLSTDGDSTPVRALNGALNSYFYSEFDDWTQELRIVSPTDRRLRWLAGLNYFSSQRLESAIKSPTPSRGARTLVDSYAGFASASFDITDQFTLTLDGRYQSDKVQLENTTFKDTFNTFLPRAVLEFKPIEDVMLYASAARGNKPGRFNSAVGTPRELVTIDEETIWSYEAGIKSQWLDRRLTVNAAGYTIDWTNQAYQDTVLQRDANGNLILAPGTNVPRTVVVTINVGKTEVKGIELDASYVLAEGWTVRGAFAYTDAKYKDFLSNLPTTYGGNRQVGGNALQNTPKFKWTISSTYEQELGSTGLRGFVSGDLTLRSKQYLDELNTSWIKKLTLLNARIGVRSDDWEVTIYGRNLTNSRVPDFATRTTDFAAIPNRNTYQVVLRPSRTFGATASLRF